MSLRALTATFELGPEVNGSDRLVLLVLADYANAEGCSFPKIRTIATRAGIRKRDTVTSALGRLERMGLIERRVNAWPGTDQRIPADKRPNLYKLLYVPADHADNRADDGTPPNGVPCPDGTPPNGGGGTPPNGVPRDPAKRGTEPSLKNPHENHPPTPRSRPTRADAQSEGGEGVDPLAEALPDAPPHERRALEAHIRREGTIRNLRAFARSPKGRDHIRDLLESYRGERRASSDLGMSPPVEATPRVMAAADQEYWAQFPDQRPLAA